MTSRAGRKHPDLTLEQVREAFTYDADSGVLRWRWRQDCGAPWNAKWAGKEVSYVSNGYKMFKLNGALHRAHRAIWLLMTGALPETDIDHADADKQNNAWANLRLATRSQNEANKGRSRANTTGRKGVYVLKHRYLAKIKVNGVSRSLGTASTVEEAAVLYEQAAKKYFGAYARAE